MGGDVQAGRGPLRQVTIAIVGKYVELHDAYLSVAEALRHGGYMRTMRRCGFAGWTPSA